MRQDGAVRAHWKEGINTGASTIVEYSPAHDLTMAVVANNKEDAIWSPIGKSTAR